MLGHSMIGDAIEKAGLFAAANRPFMLQNGGGEITRMMALHMSSTFKAATFHQVRAVGTFQFVLKSRS